MSQSIPAAPATAPPAGLAEKLSIVVAVVVALAAIAVHAVSGKDVSAAEATAATVGVTAGLIAYAVIHAHLRRPTTVAAAAADIQALADVVKGALPAAEQAAAAINESVAQARGISGIGALLTMLEQAGANLPTLTPAAALASKVPDPAPEPDAAPAGPPPTG